jgi:subtilisin family serine protease
LKGKKFMKKLLILSLCALFMSVSGVMAFTEKISPELDKVFTDSQTRNAQHKVIVIVKDPAQSITQDQENSALIKTLKNRAEVTQKRLIKKLEDINSVQAQDPINYKSLWIINAISMEAGENTIRDLSKNPEVKTVYPDTVIQLPKVKEGKALSGRADYEWSLEIMNIPEIREKYNLDGKGVVVGHLDSGIDGNHPEFKGKILKFKDFSSTYSSTPIDDNGHGTHTAGTILGGDLTGKFIGVAPEAKIISGKIFSSAGATTSGILSAMEWIVDPDGNPDTDDAPALCSNSWGGGDSESGRDMFGKAVDVWLKAGVIPVFALGNSGPRPRTCGIPGGLLTVIGVGATDKYDKIAYFSSRGPIKWDDIDMIKPDISAPGHYVNSAWTGGGYKAISGTSMACPNVAGLITLMKQYAPDLTTQEVKRLLEETALDLGDEGRDNLYGSGRVDAVKVMSKLKLLKKMND